MSETNKNIARPLYAATESGDVSILDSVLAVNAVEHPLNPGQARGREAIKQLFGGFPSHRSGFVDHHRRHHGRR